jgi:carboxypeptidase Taq
MLRVEIAMGLMDGSLRVSDLPEVWNAIMQAYLGVMPANDSEGVLRDIHWAASAFGS